MDLPITQEDASQASAEAVHKAKNAQQAIETAREAHNAVLIEETAKRTEESVFKALETIFGMGSQKSPEEMRLILQRVPILCTTVLQIQLDIGDIKDNQKWATRAFIGFAVTLCSSRVDRRSKDRIIPVI